MSTETWFITGASSGLGAALARAALHAGDRVVATARDSARLTALAETHPTRVLPLSMDLTVPWQVEAAVAAAEEWGGIDVLVNNAAIGYLAAIEEGEDENIRTIFETNVFGVGRTIRAALHGMRSRASGRIINVSSTNGVVSMPGLGYYSATKFALEALSEALSQEVATSGIRVMTIEPGGFPTGIVQRNLQSPRIAAYGPTAHILIDRLLGDKIGAYAPNDPNRIADILVELVKSHEMPQRLILGSDSWNSISRKLDEQRAEYEAWRELSLSAGYP